MGVFFVSTHCHPLPWNMLRAMPCQCASDFVWSTKPLAPLAVAMYGLVEALGFVLKCITTFLHDAGILLLPLFLLVISQHTTWHWRCIGITFLEIFKAIPRRAQGSTKDSMKVPSLIFFWHIILQPHPNQNGSPGLTPLPQKLFWKPGNPLVN